MFGDLNRAEVIGNITNDVQVRYTGTGTAVASFGLATNRRYRNQNSDEWKEEVTYHNIVIWGKQAEMLADRAKKGTRIFVSGRLQTRKWDDSEGKTNYKTEIVSEQLILLDRYERGPQQGGFNESGENITNTEINPTATTKPVKSKKTATDNGSIDPDDLPF